jgi:hypothetical protein
MGAMNLHRISDFLSSFGSIRANSWTVVLIFVTASAAYGQSTAPSTASSFEEHEWVVLVCSPFQAKANQDGMVLSTLPASADSRRQSAPDDQQNDPQPIGVIRLVGQASAPVDVSLRVPQGKVMAAWPKGKIRTDRLLWQNLIVSADLPTTGSMEGQTQPDALNATSWLNDMRRDSSAWLRNDSGMEKFLAYDLELDYTSPLKITGGRDFGYELSNHASTALRDVNLYKPDAGGWRQAEIAQLGGSSAATQGTQPAAQQTARVTLNKSPATQPADLLGPWKKRLMGEGLSDCDTDEILRILQKHALDGKRLTAVYELDGGEMDRLLPLEVLPEPSKMVRVGLVILKDADPGVANEIDQLVGQLGDDDWAKRDAAYQALAKLGKAAKPQLEKAINSKDLEVVWRAERLLAAITPTATPGQ